MPETASRRRAGIPSTIWFGTGAFSLAYGLLSRDDDLVAYESLHESLADWSSRLSSSEPQLISRELAAPRGCVVRSKFLGSDRSTFFVNTSCGRWDRTLSVAGPRLEFVREETEKGGIERPRTPQAGRGSHGGSGGRFGEAPTYRTLYHGISPHVRPAPCGLTLSPPE